MSLTIPADRVPSFDGYSGSGVKRGRGRCLRINIARAGLNGGGVSEEDPTMQICALVITTSAFILACGALAASAQQTGGPMTQQREGLERQIEGAQTPRRAIEGDRDRDDDRYGGGMMGRGYGPGWRHHQDWSAGAMGPA